MTDAPTLEQVAELLRALLDYYPWCGEGTNEEGLEQAAQAVEAAAREQGAAEVLAEWCPSDGCPDRYNLSCPLEMGPWNGGEDGDQCENYGGEMGSCWLAYARAESRKRQGPEDPARGK